jgi:tripeptidyl-peptidase-1
MRFTEIILASVCAVSVCAIPSSNHVVHEKRSEAPKYWEKRSRLNPEGVLPMRIGLTQSNLHKGDELLMEV